MEENRTIFCYIAQVFATFGMIVIIFMIFGSVVGDAAKEHSSLFILGEQGLSMKTLFQLLLLSLIITVTQVAFFSDKWIKNMGLVLRNVCFFGCIILVMILFVNLFFWFNIHDVKAWIQFIVCFAFSTGISILFTRLAEKAENKKMEQALEKFNQEI